MCLPCGPGSNVQGFVPESVVCFYFFFGNSVIQW
jgi:hypothetical protein